MSQKRCDSPTMVDSPGSEDLVVSTPNLKTRSMQEILNSSSMDTITHHDGSGNTYMAYKVLKLQTMHDPAKTSGLQVDSEIFRGCCVFVNGDTTPTRYEIQRLVVLHGGRFDAYKTSRTTHFLCDHFPNTKLTELSKNHPRITIKYVTVAWLVDSISAGRRLSEAQFIPPGLQQGQRTLAFGPSSRGNDEVVSSSVKPCGSGGGASANSSASVSAQCSSIDGVVRSRLPLHGADDSYNEDDSRVQLLDASSSPTLSTRQASTPGPGSSPEHDPSPNPTKRRSASDTNYMKQYYGASRLHFIGTWRSRLPALIKELSQEKATRGRDDSEDSYTLHRFAADTADRSCSIIHIDMDYFFVSVLIRNRPQLWTKPVAVAHSSSAGSSEVSSCNYPARALGVKAGMFMKQARALCPNLAVLRYDFAQYEEVSKQLYKICLAFSPVVQPVSVDELYVECAPGHDISAATRFLREEIFHQTGCSASAGVGKNMLLARLGTAKAKPNGLFIVPTDVPGAESSSAKKSAGLSPVMQFMATVPLRSLPGVGRKLMKKLLARSAEKPKAMPRLLEAATDGQDDKEEDEEDEEEEEEKGDDTYVPYGSASVGRYTSSSSSAFETCADLWDIPLSTLTTWVGGPTLAKSLYEACRGRDQKKLQSMQDIGAGRKSVGAEVNYGHRYESDEQGTAIQKAERFLLNLCEEVIRRLAQAQMYGYCVTVKLMKRRATAPLMSAKFMGHGACDNLSKSETLATAIGKPDTGGDLDTATTLLSRTAMSLFHSMVGTAASAAGTRRSAGSSAKFPPEDIRGMGVQVTRLEQLSGVLKTGASGSPRTGQGRHDVGLQRLFATADTSPVVKNKSEPGYAEVTRAHDFELPPASQLDYSVLAELEDSLAKNCEDEESKGPGGCSKGSSRKRKRLCFDTGASVLARERDCNGFSQLALSYSQADFVRSLPEDLRDEVLQQMPPRGGVTPPDTSSTSTAGKCLPLTFVISDENKMSDSLITGQQAAAGVPPAPSCLLPHKAASIAVLRDLLQEWAENDPVVDGEVAEARKQALTSFAIWLVRSKQLQQARALAQLLRRLEEGESDLRRSGRGLSFWAPARQDVLTAVHLSCQLVYGCAALI